MSAIGFFPTLQRAGIIYKSPATSPTTATLTPVARAPAAPPPRGVPVPTTVNPVQPIPQAQPIAGGPVIITDTHLGDPLTGAGTGSTGTSSTPTGTTTGTETSGGGGTGGTDSRLLDLLAGAFQQQDVQQGYAPQSVSSDAITPSGGSGTNPMAVVVLAIIVMAGVYFWTHRRSAAR